MWRSVLTVGFIILGTGLQSCSGGKGGPSSSISASPISDGSSGNNGTPSATEVANTQIASLNQQFNSTPQYALTSDDLQLLKDQGLLQDDDATQLQALAQQ